MSESVLEDKIGYIFRDSVILSQALSHSSFTYEKNGSSLGNERLEFLGDSILGSVIGETLFHRLPEEREGVMTKKRAQIVCEASLSVVARDIGLGDFLKLGKGELLSGGVDRSSNLSNAVEALIAAVYLDGGYDEARKLILRLFEPLIDSAIKGELIYDHKSRLIELVQSYDPPGNVDFRLIKEEGPVHARIFTIAAVFDGKVIGTGTGNSKKEAEQEASGAGIADLKGRK